MTADNRPDFARGFEVESIGPGRISVRRTGTGELWIYDIAEKNGRRQLVHLVHSASAATAGEALAIDAYDFATAAARNHGLVD